MVLQFPLTLNVNRVQWTCRDMKCDVNVEHHFKHRIKHFVSYNGKYDADMVQ